MFGVSSGSATEQVTCLGKFRRLATLVFRIHGLQLLALIAANTGEGDKATRQPTTIALN